ncbi:MAG: tail protein X [Pseudomonadales bacterium]|nr:tail protein X [Pseudomonadales bacterium]
MLYRAKEGEMVDEICWLRYGKTRGVVEKVLAANPGLAAKGPRLPAGTLVELPEIDVDQESIEEVKLPWSD